MWVLAVICSVALSGPQTRETVSAIQVHGNVLTRDDEIRRLADVREGMPFEAGTVDEVTARLRTTGRFQSVQVLKRFASIADPSQILLVIVVDEGAVHIEMTGDAAQPARVVRNRGPNFMFLPILGAEDGYGATYGARVAFANPAGARSQIAFPLTWGGDKRAAAEFEKTIRHAPIDRVTAGVSMSRRTNPFFDENDDRARVWGRGERQLVRGLRVGATAGWQRASFASERDRFVHAGADVVVDTRIDPGLPRNAVYFKAGWEHLRFAQSSSTPIEQRSVNRTELDARGYVGLFRQNVLAVRAQRIDANRPLPRYLQPLLGGMANLRGFSAGSAAGDTLVATSAELIVPLTSPLNVGKMGVSAFMDFGTVYPNGQRLADQTLRRGTGGTVWFTAAFLRLNVAVAHGRGSSTRIHVGANVSF